MIDFLLPPTELAGRWSDDALDSLAEQVAALSPTPNTPLTSIQFQNPTPTPTTLAALATRVKRDLWVEASTVYSMPYGGEVPADTPLHRFIRQSVAHYARALPQLHVAAGRVQVISDTEAEPWNPSGFKVHTDLSPRRDKRSKPDARMFDLTTTLCTINPGTVRIIFHQPVPANTGFGRYIKARIGRNKGPAPRDFLRRLKASRHPTTVAEARAGKIGTMSSATAHYRASSRTVPDIDDAQRRTFLAVDLSFHDTPHNQRVLRKFMRQQTLAQHRKPR